MGTWKYFNWVITLLAAIFTYFGILRYTEPRKPMASYRLLETQPIGPWHAHLRYREEKIKKPGIHFILRVDCDNCIPNFKHAYISTTNLHQAPPDSIDTFFRGPFNQMQCSLPGVNISKNTDTLFLIIEEWNTTRHIQSWKF